MTDNTIAAGRSGPTVCNLHDLLSALSSKVSLDATLNWFFGRYGPQDRKASLLVTSYIRVVDKAVIEYQGSRAELLVFVEAKKMQLGTYLRAVAHMETCIATVKRAVLFSDALRRAKLQGTMVGQVHLQLKSMTVRKDAARNKWNEIRNAVEHMDERIRKGLVAEDELIGLWIGDEGIELSGQKITFDELAEWMRELHALSEQLAAYHEQ